MRIKWTFSLIGLVLFLLFTPRFVLYSDYKIIGWLIYGLIFFLAPYLAFKAVDSFEIKSNKQYWRIGLACLAPLLLGPGFGLYHESRENEELKKFGQWTKGIVIHVRPTKRKNSIRCLYFVNGKRLETTYKTDWDERYKKGDSIAIIYSSNFPKIFELEYNWNKK